MKNAELLIECNKYIIAPKPRITKCQFVFTNKDYRLTGVVIRKIFAFVNSVMRYYPGVRLPIHFQLGKVQFADKLVCAILETLCYLLITEYHYPVYVSYSLLPGIAGEGGNSSPLLILNPASTDHSSKFQEKFLSDLYKNHFRKVISPSCDKTLISRMLGDIKSFLEFNYIDTAYCRELSIVVAELVGNALEHSNADCLVDVDVTNLYLSKDTLKPFLGINIVVMNFSSKRLGEDVQLRLSGNIDSLPSAYKSVKSAYKFHCTFFDQEYTAEDFFNIASFQHKISGSEKKVLTGGTGLTTVLRSVETKAESHMCYCLSGKRGLQFYPNEIIRSTEQGVGFNRENDFYNFRPNPKAILKCPINIPGTAYNLTFVIPQNKENYYDYEKNQS